MNNGFNQNGQFGGWASSSYGGGAEMYNEQYLKFVQKEQEKEKIKKISSRCFFAVIMYVLISYVLSFAIVLISWIFPSINKIYSETLPSLAFEIIVTFLAIGMPFFVIHLIFRKEKISTELPFGTTYNKEIAKYLVMIFLPVMILSAIAINYVSAIFQEILGLEFTSNMSDITLNGGKETLLGVLSVAVVPALIEETIIRGIIMQPLRKYGDKYAIIASALLFAVMHGNMVQIPYTVIGGLLLGYLAVVTGSLWPSIVLHFVNNLYSVVVLSVNDNFGENASTIVTAVMLLVFAIVGIIGIVKLTKMKCQLTLSKGNSLLTIGEKVTATLKNGPAIVALVLLTLITISNINF
jgi:membrane protease YdiL (CAAX protease family)